MTKTVLVVGAGFAGASYARELAEAGHHVTMIDQRPHIAGNAYDEVSAEGVRVHRYGPHLFHTSNAEVVKWLRRFGTLIPYEHKVKAILPAGRLVPLPVNRQTINAVFGLSLADGEAVAAFLATQGEPIEEPRNAGEYLRARIGPVLTDLFFRPYTKKMWALDLEDMDASVVKRIPLRHDDEDRYFPDDRFQFLVKDGYTALFGRLLDHARINLTLSQPFVREMLNDYDFCFNSMPIDVFFDQVFGGLPYRSIRFHHRSEPNQYGPGYASVVNYTDAGPYTRETDWSRLPAHRVTQSGRKTITVEEPCDYTDNAMERYYPVKTSDGRYEAIYLKYKVLAEKVGACNFIGRCGTYKYLDMHQVINQSRAGAQRWLASSG
jgi:UDP-galactopyranose mutase